MKEEQDQQDYMPLPPRSTKHPSERKKMFRLFYLTLIGLFVILAISLILWGQQWSVNFR